MQRSVKLYKAGEGKVNGDQNRLWLRVCGLCVVRIWQVTILIVGISPYVQNLP